MHDAHAGFAHDGELEVQQVIVVLVDRAGQGVLDRHHRPVRTALLETAENVFEPYAGQDFRRRAGEFARSFFAESPAFALKRQQSGRFANARAHSPPSGPWAALACPQRRTWESGIPRWSRTRSTL